MDVHNFTGNAMQIVNILLKNRVTMCKSEYFPTEAFTQKCKCFHQRTYCELVETIFYI